MHSECEYCYYLQHMWATCGSYAVCVHTRKIPIIFVHLFLINWNNVPVYTEQYAIWASNVWVKNHQIHLLGKFSGHTQCILILNACKLKSERNGAREENIGKMYPTICIPNWLSVSTIFLVVSKIMFAANLKCQKLSPPSPPPSCHSKTWVLIFAVESKKHFTRLSLNLLMLNIENVVDIVSYT